ncbi:MAG: substrate-binding domain-containing protein [Verrucomicrobiota bacterium]
MGNEAVKRTIGFCAAAWQGIAARWVEGALRYVTATPGLVCRDFSFLQEVATDELAPAPPWQGKADGMILAFGLSKDEPVDAVMRWIERGGSPAVSLAWDWHHPRLPVVATDFPAVLRCAAEYFIRRGFRHFAFVGSMTGDQAVMAGYHRAFDRALAAHQCRAALACDLALHPHGVREDHAQIRSEEALARLLREAPKPLAVFAINDVHAWAVCRLCEDLGLKVPGEVAVLGVGDLSVSRCHSPTSSVRTAAETVGFEAAKLLHRLMDGAAPPDQPLLIGPEGVVERESTCAGYREGGDVRRAVEFIRQHACEGIKLDDVLRHLQLARRTLDRHFAERIGHSPVEEIRRVRLERASKLLAETDLSVVKVAELCGFDDSPGLSAFFSKRTGMPPTEFRRRERK